MADQDQVAIKSMRDISQKAAMPSSVPEGFEDKTFIIPSLPDRPFSLENLYTHEEIGPFEKVEFLSEPNGVTFAHDTTTGEPIVLRVVSQRRDLRGVVMTCINDNGESVEFFVKEISGELLRIETPRL